MIPEAVVVSAAAGSITTLSANGLMFKPISYIIFIKLIYFNANALC
jgi:hypothetical protein